MSIYRLAAYDPSFRTADGSYWTWHHPELTTADLDEAYQDRIARIFPSLPSLVAPDRFIGGACSFAAEHVCWFRVLYGGRDRQGRTGRYVVLCAVAPRLAANSSGDVLRSALFEQMAAIAPHQLPLPRPDELEVTLPLSPQTTIPPATREFPMDPYVGENGLEWLAACVSSVPPKNAFSGRLVQNGERYEGCMEVTVSHIPPAARLQSAIRHPRIVSHSTVLVAAAGLIVLLLGMGWVVSCVVLTENPPSPPAGTRETLPAPENGKARKPTVPHTRP